MIEEVRNNGLYVLNGNTPGDEEGEYTYIGKRGATTIDYILTNDEGKERIGKMVVTGRVDSDHMPIETTWKEKTKSKDKKEKTITDWSAKRIEKYRNNLKEEDIKEARNWRELMEIIRKAIPKKLIQEAEGKERWIDRECRQKKKEVKKLLKRCRKKGEGQKEYYEARKEYKQLIKKKIEEEGEKMLKEIEEDRSEKKFWEMVNQNRKKREGIDENIEKEEWMRHFTKQLGGKVLGGEKEKETEREKEKRKEERDRRRITRQQEITEISLEEIEETIKHLKKKGGGPRWNRERGMVIREGES